MTHRTSNVSLTPNAMNGTKHFLVRQAAWSFGLFFLSPVLKGANRLAAMGSGRISGSSFFWMLGAKKKRHQSASLTPCQRVTGPHLRQVCGPQVEHNAHWHTNLVFDLAHGPGPPLRLSGLEKNMFGAKSSCTL